MKYECDIYLKSGQKITLPFRILKTSRDFDGLSQVQWKDENGVEVMYLCLGDISAIVNRNLEEQAQ